MNLAFMHTLFNITMHEVLFLKMVNVYTLVSLQIV